MTVEALRDGRQAMPKRGENACVSGLIRLLGSPAAPGVTTDTPRESGEHDQVRQVAVQLRVGSEVFVADTQVDRQSAAEAPIVLRIPAGGPAAEVVIVVAEAQRARLRQAQQKIGEIESRAGYRVALGIQLAGEQAAEAERSARVLIGQAVLSEPAVQESERQVVFACARRR